MVEKSRSNLRISFFVAAAAWSSLIVVACSSSSNDGSPITQDAGADDSAPSTDATTTPNDASADAGTDAAMLYGKSMTSGTRIKGVYYESADGTSSLVTLHDTSLDLDCAWGLAADGVQRCLPTHLVEASLNKPTAFEDSNCTIPLFETSATDCMPTAGSFVSASNGSCPVGNEMLAVGAAIPTPAITYVFDTQNQTCVSAGAPPAGETFYALTEVGQATFVEGHDLPASDGALGAITVAGADGSISFRTLHDRVNDTDCTYENATDGTTRCLPVSTGTVYTDFADSNCSIPAAETAHSDCNALAYARGPAPSDCKQQIPIYAAGVKIDQTFDGTPGSCSSASDPSGPDYFSTAGFVPPATFVGGIQSYVSDASARLRPSILTAGSTSVVSLANGDPMFFDSLRNEACLPIGADDGKIRCIPISITQPNNLAVIDLDGTQLFADAACTVPAAVGVTTPCTTPTYAFGLDSLCGGIATFNVKVFKITGPHTGTISAKVGGGACTTTTLPAGESAYDVSAEIPASSFVELTPAIR